MERFWKKVDKDGPVLHAELGPCWVWTAGGERYGAFRFEGRQDYAHRVGWLLQNGRIPEGLFVLHRCDNTRCVRGSHLFLGTQQENMRDRDAKGRRVNPKGERHGQAVLTDLEVQKARALAQGLPLKWIALQLNVDPSCISRIVSGQRRV